MRVPKGKGGYTMNSTKKMVIMAGLPASGKSTYAAATFSRGTYAIVDCDELKKTIPGYDPKNPAAVHAQSKVMEKEAIYSNMAHGASFVYDTTATDTDKVLALILEAKALGYRVAIHYIKVSLATAIKRNAARERVVPEAIITSKFEKIEASMMVLRQFADEFNQIKND